MARPRHLLAALAVCTLSITPTAADAADTGLIIGFTHGHTSADQWGKPAAVARARQLMARNFTVQNQHIMGWGALNPEPAPGVYDFATLDARVALMRQTGSTPVITLCCSPDWMKQSGLGTTEWADLEAAPHPDHYDDFASLAATVARRYPDVHHFVVWNELKGFYDRGRNRWDIESYTVLYNKVATALKEVNPQIQVGGPYIPMDSWSSPAKASHPSAVRGAWGVLDQRALDALDYWLANAEYADFVSIDGSTSTKDQGVIGDPVAATAKFADVTAAVRARTDLPIWWSEVHLRFKGTPSINTVIAAHEAAIDALERSGADVALFWSPEQTGTTCTGCFWTSTRTSRGGQPTVLLNDISDMLVPRRR